MLNIKQKLKQLVSQETGTVKKDHGGKTSVALVYPNTYFVGMSNLGVHNVYRLINEDPAQVCERAFLPERADIAEHRRTNTPILTMESQRPISDFDTIAFSVAFENDFENIKTILELAKVSKGRPPKIIIGGAAVTLNPQLFKGLADEVIAGDFENTRIFGGSFARRNLWRAQDDVVLAHNVIWTPNTEFGSMHLVEIQRGCPHRCNFCAAPVIYRPFVQFSKDAIIEAINTGLSHRKKIGLIGGDVLAHPNFEEVVEYIHSQGATFSPSSVRADRITPKIASLLQESGHKTVTLAPETGSEALRGRIGKNVPDEKFFKAVEILATHGIKQIKLYFMIGLPGETDEDVAEIADFVQRLAMSERKRVEWLFKGCSKACPERAQASRRVVVAVGPFVPKRGTSFEKEPFAGINVLKKKISILKKLMNRTGVTLRFESPAAALREYKMQQ